MAFQKVEFTFPEDENDVEVESTNAVEIDLSGSKTVDEYADTSTESELETQAKEEPDDFEIEVVDDTLEDDSDFDPRAPKDVTDAELKGYSRKVRRRIAHLNKGFQDARREKATIQRERQELEALAQRLVNENKELKGNVTKNQEALLEQAKKNAAIEMESAKRSYKTAYDSGDSDAVLEAQDKLTSAKIKTDKLNNFQIPALQEEETAVQEPQHVESNVPRDPNAEAWVAKNSWFNEDPEMRSFAYGVHEKLVQQGVSPQDDTYYERIDARMRQVFPDYFGEQTIDSEPKRRPNVVAPATRSTVPKKVHLSPTQVTLAKRLGVPLEEYAKQVALEMRKA